MPSVNSSLFSHIPNPFHRSPFHPTSSLSHPTDALTTSPTTTSPTNPTLTLTLPLTLNIYYNSSPSHQPLSAEKQAQGTDDIFSIGRYKANGDQGPPWFVDAVAAKAGTVGRAGNKGSGRAWMTQPDEIDLKESEVVDSMTDNVGEGKWVLKMQEGSVAGSDERWFAKRERGYFESLEAEADGGSGSGRHVWRGLFSHHGRTPDSTTTTINQTRPNPPSKYFLDRIIFDTSGSGCDAHTTSRARDQKVIRMYVSEAQYLFSRRSPGEALEETAMTVVTATEEAKASTAVGTLPPFGDGAHMRVAGASC